MILLAEIADKIPSIGDTAVLGGLLAFVAAWLALLRWWVGLFVCLCSCALLLIGAFQDLTDSMLRPLISGEFGGHYPWARVLTSVVPLLAAPWITFMWKRQRALGRQRSGRCIHCGYALATSGALACPECGRQVSGPNAASSVVTTAMY